MDEILEFILELFIEGSIEIGSNKKVSKWIRYPLLVICILFFLVVIGLVMFTGILLFKENTLAGLLLIGCGIFMLVGFIIKFRKIYLKMKSN